MNRSYCVVWNMASWSERFNPHYTTVKIPYGPITLQRILEELVKELKAQDYNLEASDIQIVSWNLLE